MRTTLSKRDAAAFLKMLKEPPRINAALRKAAENYRKAKSTGTLKS